MKLAVLASGAGSILEAILDDGIGVALVIADRPCRALDSAQSRGIPCELIKRGNGHDFDRVHYTRTIVELLERHAIDIVAMAGFMTILEKPIFEKFHRRVLNTHPSLLPAFKGPKAVQDALVYGVKITGCTIHIATPELDDGPILAQEAVSVLDTDTVETLHERIKCVERRLYPEVLWQIIAQCGMKN